MSSTLNFHEGFLSVSFSCLVNDMTESEVADLSHSVLILVFRSLQENILQLHICVYDSLRMDILKALEDVLSKGLHFVFILDWVEVLQGKRFYLRQESSWTSSHLYQRVPYTWRILSQIQNIRRARPRFRDTWQSALRTLSKRIGWLSR